MTIKRYTVKFTHTNINVANPALVNFVADGGGSDAENAASILAYLAGMGGIFSSGTNVVDVSVRPAGSAGGTSLAFPATEYATLSGIASLPSWTGYGSLPGATGALTPLGTSISVSERTATVGPTGRGRHFLPMVNTAIVTSGGVLNGTDITLVHDSYDFWLRGGSGGPAFNPSVSNHTLAHAFHITSVKPQPIFSNLESRRR